MKKVLFLITSLGGGGAEHVLVNLVNNLDRKKYDITVQTLFDVGVNRRYLNKNIKYIGGFKKQIPGNVMLFKLFSPEFLYKRIIKDKYDIAVSYLEGPTARIISGCPFDSKLVSWIHTIHNTAQTAAYSFRSVEEAQKCYSKFDETVCVANRVKEDFKSIFDISKPCEVLYNTNEDEKIIEKSIEEVTDYDFSNKLVISSVGRLRPEKGYDRLIKAHKQLLDKGIKNEVIILGEGSEREKLQEMINSLGVSNTFKLLGFNDNPYKYVKRSDLFICSSRCEGFSTAVTEALILGVPVVSTDCSGAYELLGENNEYGIVTENSSKGVFDGLYKVLSQPNLLKEYKVKAQQRGLYFSKDNTVKAVEDMLEKL